MADIFISYAHEDIERIKVLASGLASCGRSVFWDRTIPPGKTWRNWIGKSLAEARCVVVAWSEASIHSEWVYEEAEEGKERNILVPVFVGNVRPPMGFRAIQGATLVDWNGGLDDQSFQQLVDAVAEILGPVEPTPENSLRLQSISKQPVVSTAPVDLQVAETTPALTAAQSVETPGDAQASQLRGKSRDRGHRWLWIAGASLLPVLYAVWEVAVHTKPATVDPIPEMVEIPAGSFNMGSPDSEPGRDDTERPAHKVTIKRFALGLYEVTFAEYDAFALATGRKLPDDEGWGRERRPVINVSWDDAQAYAQWLSERAGKRYRLPTEAEWEYAARAKTTTTRFWGDNPADACQYANVEDESHKCTDGYQYTAPVGAFKSNDFGTYDMLGNVWEWVQDCYYANYQGAFTDGAAWEENGCAGRVVRGGCWGYRPGGVRSAFRHWDRPGSRLDVIGFRLAQDI